MVTAAPPEVAAAEAAGPRIVAVEPDFGDNESGRDVLAPVRWREMYVAVVSRYWETDTSALTARGFDLSRVRLHAPIGLPIGGDSPGEIAISILAEVISTRYEKAADA